MKSANQKLKILYLQKILLDLTDETHSISMAEIIAELAKHDISAERKSLYNDIECLRQYGMDIIGEKRDGEEPFTASVTVDVSNQFFHWVMALGRGAEIIGPEWVVEEVRKEVEQLFEQYEVHKGEASGTQ